MNYNVKIITRPEFLFSFFIKAFSKFFPIPTNTKNRKILAQTALKKLYSNFKT